MQITGFADYLLAKGLLDKKKLEFVQKSKTSPTSFIYSLIQNKLIKTRQLALATAEYFALPLFDLDGYDIKSMPKDLLRLPIVEKRQGLPLGIVNKSVYIAVIDPTLQILSEIGFHTGLNVHFVIVEEEKLVYLIDKALDTQFMSSFADISASDLKHMDINSFVDESNSDLNYIDANSNSLVVRFVYKIIFQAIDKNASDIHFEPYEKFYRVRLRVDGILHEVAQVPIRVSKNLAMRLKVMANLNIAEHRLPQDGRFKLNLFKERTVDFRISTCPTYFGEKVVLRLLNANKQSIKIESLGMDECQQKIFLQAVHQAHGMILVTGPTGSGKTITLYSILNILNSMEKNITTVEDPIEINIAGINQVAVNSKIELTFLAALRTFLRQDPDIIMVGEIRDLETAEVAVRAAQTGHLVVSTLHTNSAAETLTRLNGMGISAFNLASSIKLIIAQRLVRCLCQKCKQKQKLPSKALASEGFTEKEMDALTVYSAANCTECIDGYKGRVGVFEVMPVSHQIGQLIMQGSNAMQIVQQAKIEHVMGLRQAGLKKVKQGITSLAEINRVIGK